MSVQLGGTLEGPCMQDLVTYFWLHNMVKVRSLQLASSTDRSQALPPLGLSSPWEQWHHHRMGLISTRGNIYLSDEAGHRKVKRKARFCLSEVAERHESWFEFNLMLSLRRSINLQSQFTCRMLSYRLIYCPLSHSYSLLVKSKSNSWGCVYQELLEWDAAIIHLS